MTGAIAMGTNKITGVGDPTNPQDVSTKAYSDLKLPLTGGTLSGALAMGTNKITGMGTPTVSTDAATKGYVDGVCAFLPSIYNDDDLEKMSGKILLAQSLQLLPYRPFFVSCRNDHTQPKARREAIRHEMGEFPPMPYI
jgi:hypothetical protein